MTDSVTPPPQGMWQALRHDPTHAPDIGVLYALPQLTAHVESWAVRNASRHRLEPTARQASRVLRRSTNVARRGGLITGSSFYVGMVPAMLMIYLEQLIVVLRIAAVYGRDPSDPMRAAEILVIQGRYPDVAAALAALERAGMPAQLRREASGVRTAAELVRQLPSMIGLRVRKLTSRTPIDLVIAGVEIASFLVPVVSLPVWAVANARATRRLGHAATNFYSRSPANDRGPVPVVLPPRPRVRTRRLVIATVVPLAMALGVLFAFLPIGRYGHHLRWLGFALSELALALTFLRLMRVTRVPGN